jgi:hypothetical protein
MSFFTFFRVFSPERNDIISLQFEMVKYDIIERLHQGHLHPPLEVPSLTSLGRESNPGLHGGRRAL